MNVKVFVFLFFFASLASAQTSFFGQVSDYGRQYEASELSFLQFSVLLANEREKLFDEMNARTITVMVGDYEEQGWDVATMRSMFGEPTGLERWAWSPNLGESIRLEKPVPRWEKKIYSGSKVEITFNGWPHVIKRESELILFYNFDLDFNFKEKQEFNIGEMVGEVKGLIEQGRSNPEKLKEAAFKSVEFERILEDYLQDNENACKEILKQWFNQSSSEIYKTLEWKATLYAGEKIEAFLAADEWPESVWHTFYSRIDFDTRIDTAAPPEAKVFTFNYTTAAEYFSAIRETLFELKRTAANFDSNPSSDNYRYMHELGQKYEALVDSATDKAGREELDIMQDELVKKFAELFGEHGNFIREVDSTTEFSKRLVNVSQEVSGSYCTSSETSCGEYETCVNAVCILAKGGSEQCTNSVDDDGDYIADCDDPDCFEEVSCGKKCNAVCGGENGCWECSSQECGRECDACDQCNDNNPDNPEACSQICDACSQCTDTKCSARCDACWECEDEYYGNGCRSECNACNSCYDSDKGDCSAECLQCNKCNFDRGNTKCDAPQILDSSTYTCNCPGCDECDKCYESGAENCEENPACVSCNKCGYESGGRTCEPPHLLDQRTYSCNCPDVECPDGQYQEGETCKCVVSEESISEVPRENIPTPTTEPQVVEPTQKANPPIVSQAGSRRISALPFSPITGLVEGISGEACGGVCSANQYCNSADGYCECNAGSFDCDGDWQNGCESTTDCKSCERDVDCAPSRCSEDHLRVANFKCEQGEKWIEERASAEFTGRCSRSDSGETQEEVHFSAWGEGFVNFEEYRQQAWSASDENYCEFELEQAVKERLQLQSSLNDEFFDWFFANIVVDNPDGFEQHMRKMFTIYDEFQQNSDETARALRCLGRSDWPSEYVPVNAEIKTEFGKVKIWEEMKKTSFWGTEQEILSPYMSMWVFPPKPVFKKFFTEKIREEGPQGPSPEELAMMREWPPAMEKIKKIANAFGGDARIVVQAVDEGKPLVKFIFIVNERDLIRIEGAENYRGPVSATISVSLDFVYDVASSVAKEMEGEHVQYPYWEQSQQPPTVFNDAVDAVKIFIRIFRGMATGEISIQPPSALPQIIFILQEMMSMMMQAP